MAFFASAVSLCAAISGCCIRDQPFVEEKVGEVDTFLRVARGAVAQVEQELLRALLLKLVDGRGYVTH